MTTQLTRLKAWMQSKVQPLRRAVPWHIAIRRLPMTCLLLLILSGGSAVAQTPATIVLATDIDANSFGNLWTKLIFTEAFKRLGVSLQIIGLPMARRGVMEDSGEVDGDMGRTALYGAEHPNLLRVEEPFTDMSFAIYTANPALNMHTLDELRASDLVVEYRRGVLFCEGKLKPLQLKQLADITSSDQGMKKLLVKRSDLYCDLELEARRALNLPEFKNEARLRKLISLGSMPIHIYLHRKHAKLAQRLSGTIKTMKAEGMIEKYRQQVERELGWSR